MVRTYASKQASRRKSPLDEHQRQQRTALFRLIAGSSLHEHDKLLARACAEMAVRGSHGSASALKALLRLLEKATPNPIASPPLEVDLQLLRDLAGLQPTSGPTQSDEASGDELASSRAAPPLGDTRGGLGRGAPGVPEGPNPTYTNRANTPSDKYGSPNCTKKGALLDRRTPRTPLPPPANPLDPTQIKALGDALSSKGLQQALQGLIGEQAPRTTGSSREAPEGAVTTPRGHVLLNLEAPEYRRGGPAFRLLSYHLHPAYKGTPSIVRLILDPPDLATDYWVKRAMVSSGLDFRELSYKRIHPPGPTSQRRANLDTPDGCSVTHQPSGLTGVCTKWADYERNRAEAEHVLSHKVAWWKKTKGVK